MKLVPFFIKEFHLSPLTYFLQIYAVHFMTRSLGDSILPKYLLLVRKLMPKLVPF